MSSHCIVWLVIFTCFGLPFVGFSQGALELVHYEVEELEDAAERMASGDWIANPETGEMVFEELSFLMTISPDQRWILLGAQVHGLDVQTYKLFLVSTENPQLITLVDQALGAVFSPTSEHLFVSTGPNPIIFDLASMRGVVLIDISSGLEHYPCWVVEWSEDGAELIIHQQARFDAPSSPKAWKVTVK